MCPTAPLLAPSELWDQRTGPCAALPQAFVYILLTSRWLPPELPGEKLHPSPQEET